MKNNIKINKLTLILFVGFVSILWSCKATKEAAKVKVDTAQNIENPKENEEQTQPMLTNQKNLSRIKNTNGLTHELVFANGKSYDINKNNPYNNFAFNKESENKHGNNIYSFESVELKGVFEDFDSVYYANNTADVMVNRMQSFHQLLEFEGGVIIAYQNRAYYNNAVQGFQSSLEILDNDGNEISNISNLNTNILDIEIANDKSFIAFMHGYMDPDYGFIINQGVKAISLHTGNIIFQAENEDIGFFIKNDMLFVGIIINEREFRGTDMDIIDLKKHLQYSRRFTIEEESKILDIDSAGYILKDNGNEIRLDFNEDFKVIKL